MWDSEKGVWKGDKAQTDASALPTPLWIFGYGSLCWKNDDLKYSNKKIASLKGFKRRFHQRS